MLSESTSMNAFLNMPEETHHAQGTQHTHMYVHRYKQRAKQK